MYCNGRLEGEADDVRLRVEGPITDLRSDESVERDEEQENPVVNQEAVSASRSSNLLMLPLIGGFMSCGHVNCKRNEHGWIAEASVRFV